MTEEYDTEIQTSIVSSTPKMVAKTLRDLSTRPEMDDLDVDTLLRMAVTLEGMDQVMWRAVQLVNTCICDTNDHFVVGELTCPIVFYKVLDIETEEGEKENDG